MRIIVNGKDKTVTAGASIQQFLREQGVQPESVVIEYNRAILDRSQWDTTVLRDNDVLEIIHFVGGG